MAQANAIGSTSALAGKWLVGYYIMDDVGQDDCCGRPRMVAWSAR